MAPLKEGLSSPGMRGPFRWSLGPSSFAALFMTSFCLAGYFSRAMDGNGAPGVSARGNALGPAARWTVYQSPFWGMLIPVTLIGVNGLNHYFPAVPQIEVRLNRRSFA